jgi:hypothetical protein
MNSVMMSLNRKGGFPERWAIEAVLSTQDPGDNVDEDRAWSRGSDDGALKENATSFCHQHLFGDR